MLVRVRSLRGNSTHREVKLRAGRPLTRPRAGRGRRRKRLTTCAPGRARGTGQWLVVPRRLCRPGATSRSVATPVAKE